MSSKQTAKRLKDKVNVIGIGPGWIAKISLDDRRDGLYLILMEDASATPTGFFLARDFEFTVVGNSNA